MAIGFGSKSNGRNDPTLADGRDARLSRSLSGTNLERAGDYNLRAVLQAVRLSGDTTRVAIAQQTGLTAPTIANITSRLVEMGLVRNAGRMQGGRGQPALRLQVNPDGAFAIGLNIDRDHLTLVTLDLAGQVRSRSTREIAFAMPDDVVAFVTEDIDRVIADGGVDRDRILGVGVAIPDDLGRIALPHRPAGYDRWNAVDLSAMLSVLPWPIHCDNDAAAAALGEAEYGTGFDNPSFFYLLISAGLGGGPVIDRSYHRGANARSGEIGLMPDTTGPPGATVQDTVSLSALFARLERAGFAKPNVEDLGGGDPLMAPVIEGWLADAVRALTAPLVAINCLLDPDAILIGGRLPMPLIERLADGLTDALNAVPQPSRATVMPAVMARDAPAIGAAILPFLDHILPSDSILIQSGRR
ncbi:ROK family transcriptional regulator [Sphingomonas sp. CD22]|jgi:predicted NBD/HSP70 family sugar kinase|uniref:ROK family transcriptional regulator n=1 Tax=Sphingomonas sp. CD22 TaxID=3100214 RepID=UPI002ADF4E9A|nr:ROK family transcriptional regulator [Sphingomonas sp. CD22]MEA1085148.1 ROK family transcriptional regulator [Sphingomonas sp. CD22]